MQHWAAPKSPDNDAVMGREKSGRRAGMAGSSVWRLAERVQQAHEGERSKIPRSSLGFTSLLPARPDDQ